VIRKEVLTLFALFAKHLQLWECFVIANEGNAPQILTIDQKKAFALIATRSVQSIGMGFVQK
jgi:hypothetical protein